MSGFPHPNILLAGIARHIWKTILLKHVIDKAGAIHSAIFRICGAIGVTEILFCQRHPCVEDLAYPWRIIFVPCYLIRRQTHVRPGFLSWSTFGARNHWRFRRRRGRTLLWLRRWSWTRVFSLRFAHRRRSRRRSLSPWRSGRRWRGRRFLRGGLPMFTGRTRGWRRRENLFDLFA